MCGLYRSWRGGDLFREIRNLTVAWGGVVVSLIILAFMTKDSAIFSRVWIGSWALSGWGLLIIFHISIRIFLRWVRQRNFNVRRVAIIGAGELGKKVAHNIQSSPWTGLKVVGFYDDNADLHGQKIEGIKVKGTPARLARLSTRPVLDEVWLALPLRAEHRVREILHDLRHSTATVRFVPDIFGFRLLNHSIMEVAGVPVLDLTSSPMYGLNRIIKAIEDKVLALMILAVISPLMLTFAIGVKLSSPGPVFYRQKRVGWNNRPFTMLKFRSMPINAESQTGPVWANADDCRKTRFGSFLRRTSLDELPQFINVLKGDMSIVGPRPERPIFVKKFKEEVPDYMKKHMVKAGITGWAQVNGWRGNTDLCKRIEYDMYYIENWSLWFDLRIIFRTLFTGLVHKHAY